VPSFNAQEKPLRRRCEERVEQLHLPYRFTTQELCDTIVRSRGKPIIVRPLRTSEVTDVPCGIRLETPDADLLFYEDRTSLLHKRHILTHELCHVICDHPGSLAVDTSAAEVLGFDPTLVLRMSGRAGYATEDEREAEMMATVIRQRIYRERTLPPDRPAKGAESWEALFSKRGRRAGNQP
jgi:hypothetical protein